MNIPSTNVALRCYELPGTHLLFMFNDGGRKNEKTLKHSMTWLIGKTWQNEPNSEPNTQINIQPTKNNIPKIIPCFFCVGSKWRLKFSPLPPGFWDRWDSWHLHLSIRLMIHRIQQWHQSSRTPIRWPHGSKVLHPWELDMTWIAPVILRILGFQIAPHLVGKYITHGDIKSLPQYHRVENPPFSIGNIHRLIHEGFSRQSS